MANCPCWLAGYKKGLRKGVDIAVAAVKEGIPKRLRIRKRARRHRVKAYKRPGGK